MGKLGDILGDDFEEEYEEKRNERREEARKVEKDVLMEIAYQAIKGGGFDGEEPRFRFDAGDIDHDVLLMESPEDNLQKFQWDLGEDAKTQGMFHLNQLFSLAFQENMVHLLEKIKADEYYLVVGKYKEKTQEDSDGNTETYYNINPVRGIIPLEVAQTYAEKYEDHMQGASVEEQSQDQHSGDSEVDLDDTSDSSDKVDKDRIIEVFQAIGDKAPEVLESVAEGDSDSIDKLVTVTNNNLDKTADRERILDIFEEAVEEIPGRGEDEEEDDGGIDLGGIGGDEDEEDDSPDEEMEDDSDEEEVTEDAGDEADGEDEEDGDVDDWF